MAGEKVKRRYPLYAGEGLLGWFWVWEPPPLLEMRHAYGVFEPGPEFEPHRPLFEDVMAMVRALDAWEGEDTEARESLEERCSSRTREIAELDLTIGDDRYPVENVALFDEWLMYLYPPREGFGSLAIDPARVKPEIWNLSPLPSHLAGWSGEVEIEGHFVSAAVRCPCGSERLEFHCTGIAEEPDDVVIPKSVELGGEWFFLVKAVCETCRREHVLFDNLHHGHDGFVYHSPRKAALPRPPLHRLHCPKCGAAAHRGRVTIVSDFKERYFEEGDAKRCGPERWPDAYGCFAMGVTCCGCGLPTTGWIDYECR